MKELTMNEIRDSLRAYERNGMTLEQVEDKIAKLADTDFSEGWLKRKLVDVVLYDLLDCHGYGDVEYIDRTVHQSVSSMVSTSWVKGKLTNLQEAQEYVDNWIDNMKDYF